MNDGNTDNSGNNGNLNNTDLNRRHLLLHSCCGPCSSAVLERLVTRFDVTLFFCNPNITDKEEYEKRKATQLQFLEAFNKNLPEGAKPVAFLEGSWNPELFFKAVEGLEKEPERGVRCDVCFRLRLAESAAMAAAIGADLYTTTLSVSPHKQFPVLCRFGNEEGAAFGIPFLEEDFKKKDGYKRSIELSRIHNLYRQNFCGCEFSRR